MGVTINYEKCKLDCFQCMEICPYDVFWPNEEASGSRAGKPEVRYPEDCNNCYFLWSCERVCPVKAIETTTEFAYKTWFPV